MAKAALDTALLSAHATRDHVALVGLYAQAAEQTADPAARPFFLTHAYIYALELGDARAETLRAALVEIGADTAL